MSEQGKEPYFVEVNNDGCSRCGHDRTWTVVGPDGVALGQSWVDEDDAQDVADWLNEAYEAGRGAILHGQQGGKA